jgi:hypothetical protein
MSDEDEGVGWFDCYEVDGEGQAPDSTIRRQRFHLRFTLACGPGDLTGADPNAGGMRTIAAPSVHRPRPP